MIPPIISHGIWRWLTAFTEGARLLLPEVLPLGICVLKVMPACGPARWGHVGAGSPPGRRV